MPLSLFSLARLVELSRPHLASISLNGMFSFDMKAI